MDKIPLSFNLDSTNYDAKLSFTMHHNGKKVYECAHVNKKLNVSLSIDDNSDTHELTWTLSGKEVSHTEVDKSGKIVKDAALITSNFKINDFELAERFVNNSNYIHDYNGTSEQVTERYDNYFGCNGTVHFTFTSPVHIWILQNW